MLDESVAVYCLATKFMPKAPKFQKVSSEVCIFRFAKQIIRNSLWTSWNKLPWNKRRPNAKAFWEEDEEIVGGSPHLFPDSLCWNLEILLSRQFNDFLWKIFVKLFHLLKNDHCESFSRNIFQIRVKLSFFCNVPFEPLLESLHLRKSMLHKSIWIELTKYFSFFQTHDVGFERLIKIIFGKHGGAVVVFSKPWWWYPHFS